MYPLSFGPPGRSLRIGHGGVKQGSRAGGVAYEVADIMDLLRRFLTLTFRENQTELQRSEMPRDQIWIIAQSVWLA
jgi:hypothetical protein